MAYFSLLMSLLVVGTLNTWLQLDDNARLISVAGVMGLFLIGLLRGRGQRGTSWLPVSSLIRRVRFGIHGFFILELMVSRLVLKMPLLLVVALRVQSTAVSFAEHTGLSLRRVAGRLGSQAFHILVVASSLPPLTR
jgi:hypothetical protein